MIHAREDYNRIQDPLNLIKEDEPVFLIRAKDMNAPAAVRAWARLAHDNGAAPNIVQAAMAQADKMRQWQIDNFESSRIPDMP